MELERLYCRLKSLTAYRELLDEPVLAAAVELLGCLWQGQGLAALDAWGTLVALLEKENYLEIGPWLDDRLRCSDAPWPHLAAQGKGEQLAPHALRDVETLTALAALDGGTLQQALSELLPTGARQVPQQLPVWSGQVPFTFESLKQCYRLHGAGSFVRHRAFVWEDGRLFPIPHPDVPRQEELIGYRRQRAQVEENTRALLAGRTVNNILLYGESGTGKSATVKSLLSLPDTEDLRLVEIEKGSIRQMPQLIRQLAGRRQKFILFIDDLAFDQDDQTYSALKTILEGGLEPRPANVAIYATSNRRSLVRQTFSDRAGDEVDRDETIQEKTALADRFGLRISYLGLSIQEYLELIQYLADRDGLSIPSDQLRAQAVRWDVRHPGRSPRTARQFVASLER